jgi:microcystin-dependent protein
MSMNASVNATIILPVPIGTVVPNIFNQSDPPPGWLPCDGSTFDSTKYPTLYQMLGNSNVLPDLRGYFLRGLDTSGKVDPDGAGRKLLSVQTDQLASHTHTVSPMAHWSRSFEGSNQTPGLPYCSDIEGSLTSGATGGNENRPKNVAVNYLIFAGLLATDEEAGRKSSNDFE